MALHRASKCQDAEKSVAMIDHLLDKHHMDIEADNDDRAMRDTMNFSGDSGTPLNCAVYYRNLAAVKHLLKRGAKPSDAAPQSAGRRWGRQVYEPFLSALGPLLEAGADPGRTLEVAVYENNIEAAKICLEAGADPRKIISSQEARAARLAARPERRSDDEEEYWDEDYPWDNESDAAWNGEIESLLRSLC
jgi:hypothetical protein